MGIEANGRTIYEAPNGNRYYLKKDDSDGYVLGNLVAHTPISISSNINIVYNTSVFI